jgi:KaiC/GvpD/RAD55 family RecA-like ATPase|tara:strand:- start:1510 stop:2904 length:1395 start_codon:yes stop_codon:yes gene_type:complete
MSYVKGDRGGNMKRTDFSHFGKSFQEALCLLILEDRPFADQILEVFDITFLELGYLRLFVSKIIAYRLKYGVHPTKKIMNTIIKSDLEKENEAIQKQVRDYFATIMVSDQIKDSEFIKDKALEFCRKQKLKGAMLKSVDLLQTCSFDEISKIINDALVLGSDSNFGYDYLVDFEKRFELKARNPITTGWGEVDKISKDGLGQGELGVVVAPTGAGKSMVLTHLGAAALMKGVNVIHYTLELSDTTIASRYDSCITGVPLSDLFSFKELIYEKVEDVKGKLIVKEYPTKSASTRTIRNHLEKLINRGVDPGLVIIDYGDLLRPVTVRKEKRNELESIYEEMRAIAQEFKCPVWTASQTNRSGLNAEVITMESISEAFNKCFVADFIFTVSRTMEDKNANSGRIYVAKNRNGPDGLVYPIFMDTSNVKIRVLPPSDEEESELTAKSQSDVLKEKYQKFKKQQRESI